MSLRRFASMAAAAALLLPGAWLSASAADESCTTHRTALTGNRGTWISSTLPPFTFGPSVPALHAIDPVDPNRWWLSNGKQVLQSLNAGCTWKAFYTLPSTPSPSAPYTRDRDEITRLSVSSSGAGHDMLFASVRALKVPLPAGVEPPGGVVPPATVPSATLPAAAVTYVIAGTQTLGPLGMLAQPIGEPGPLTVAPSSSKVVYAVAGGVVNASLDGGVTWTAQPITQPRRGQSVDSTTHPVSELKVDPTNAKAVWAVVDGAYLYSSLDGFATTEDSVQATQSGWLLTGLDVAHPGGKPMRIDVFETSGAKGPVRGLLHSENEDHRFTLTPEPSLGIVDGAPESVAHFASTGALVFPTTDKGDPRSYPRTSVYASRTPTTLGDIDQFQLSPLRQVQSDSRLDPAFYFLGRSSLVIWKPPAGSLNTILTAPGGNPVIDVPGFGNLPALINATTTTPAKPSFSIPNGETRRQRFDIEVPPQFVKLDVFFMLDTSQSMDDVVNALANSFVEVSNDLLARRIDLNIGLGEYQDWNGAGVRYTRLVDISRPGQEFRDALQSITTDGGFEPMYTALDQMATGSGLIDPSKGSPIAPGQDAHWRPGAYRVVVNASDEDPESDPSSTSQSGNNSIDPDGPTLIRAAADLAARAIHHVGFVVKREVAPTGAADPAANSESVYLTKRMHDLAAGTRTFAPTGGIDCNNDGRVDLAPGAPIVCPIYTGQVGYRPEAGKPGQTIGKHRISKIDIRRPLIAVLDSIRTYEQASLESLNAKHPGLTVTLTPAGSYTHLNARFPHDLRYTLTLTCSKEALGDRSYYLPLVPKVGGRFSTPAIAQVTCVAPKQPPLVIPLGPPLVAGAIVPQNPPNPPSVAQPAQVQQPAQAQNPAANPQVGAAEEEEAALAFAGAAPPPMEVNEEEQTTLAMSMVGLTVVAGVGCAVAVRQSRRRQPAWAKAQL